MYFGRDFRKKNPSKPKECYFKGALPLVAATCILASSPTAPKSEIVLTPEDSIRLQKQIRRDFNMLKGAGILTISSGLAIAGLIIYMLRSQDRRE